MNTHRWGPLFWNFLHGVPLAYTLSNETLSLEKQEKLRRFSFLLSKMLPCRKCRRHFLQHWNKGLAEFDASTILSWFFWWHSLHNKVNIMMKRPVFEDKVYLLKQWLARRTRLKQWFWYIEGVWECLFILTLNYDNNPDQEAYVEFLSLLFFDLFITERSRMLMEKDDRKTVEAEMMSLHSSDEWFRWIYEKYRLWKGFDRFCNIVKKGVSKYCPTEEELAKSILLRYGAH